MCVYFSCTFCMFQLSQNVRKWMDIWITDLILFSLLKISKWFSLTWMYTLRNIYVQTYSQLWYLVILLRLTKSTCTLPSHDVPVVCATFCTSKVFIFYYFYSRKWWICLHIHCQFISKFRVAKNVRVLMQMYMPVLGISNDGSYILW